jgi:hypothetical protein
MIIKLVASLLHWWITFFHVVVIFTMYLPGLSQLSYFPLKILYLLVFLAYNLQLLSFKPLDLVHVLPELGIFVLVHGV